MRAMNTSQSRIPRVMMPLNLSPPAGEVVPQRIVVDATPTTGILKPHPCFPSSLSGTAACPNSRISHTYTYMNPIVAAVLPALLAAGLAALLMSYLPALRRPGTRRSPAPPGNLGCVLRCRRHPSPSGPSRAPCHGQVSKQHLLQTGAG